VLFDTGFNDRGMDSIERCNQNELYIWNHFAGFEKKCYHNQYQMMVDVIVDVILSDNQTSETFVHNLLRDHIKQLQE
jgi:hypothetical protein